MPSPLQFIFSFLDEIRIFRRKTKKTCHHVFISFRGDTRSGFTSHLEASFTRHGIVAFLDHQIERGTDTFPRILRAIKQSEILVIVFSRDYATSKWCLDELVEIMESRRKRKQIMIPIFYGVRPSEVRHQSGNYAAAFANHERSYACRRVQRWRRAMTEAANVSGWDFASYRTESQLVEEIAIDVKKKIESIGKAAGGARLQHYSTIAPLV